MRNQTVPSCPQANPAWEPGKPGVPVCSWGDLGYLLLPFMAKKSGNGVNCPEKMFWTLHVFFKSEVD